MIKRITAILSFFLLGGLTNLQAQSIKLVDPLEPIYPDTNHVEQYSANYREDFPLNTNADVHLLIETAPGSRISVSADISKRPVPLSAWSQLLDVPVERNTGLTGRTEIYNHQINPYVIRRAPFRIYEAIQPLKQAQVVSASKFTALRLSIDRSLISKAGEYTCYILVKGKGWQRKAVFTIKVYPVKLPSVANQQFFYTNWFNIVQMEKRQHVERWTKDWFAMLDKYARLMAHGRQNCINIPDELLSYQNNHITLDEKRLLDYIAVFRKYGFKYFESPHIMYRGDNDDWNDPELKVFLTKRRYHTPEAKLDVDTMAHLIKNFCVKNNLEHSWLQHISDEPKQVQAKCYREVVAQVRSIYPAIKIIEATNDRDSLAGSVDLWCPTIDDYQENRAFFDERKKHNENVLVYTCLTPGGKWLNRTLDEERLRQVYFGWAAAKYNTLGFLHWGLNQYHVPDPLQQSVVHHFAPGAALNNELPPGDTHIIYPGADGPLSSQRFESYRIGIEDYELLRILQSKDSLAAAGIIAQTFTSYNDYNTSVKKYRGAKVQLLKALSVNSIKGTAK